MEKANERPCYECETNDEMIEVVCTDDGWFCWGCHERKYAMCKHCEEMKEIEKDCGYCGK